MRTESVQLCPERDVPAARSVNGIAYFLQALKVCLHLCLVLCTDNDLWGHTVEAGVRAPGVGAETVGIYLFLRDGLPDLGKKLLLDMWVDHNKGIANRIANLSNILDIARKTEDISLNLKT